VHLAISNWRLPTGDFSTRTAESRVVGCFRKYSAWWTI
jgi:hypothetical protein